VYARGHEGRGIGLANKIRAYALQDGGLDTVDANLELGFPADCRQFDEAASIIHSLGVGSVRLLTNNPRKVDRLRASGVAISTVEPIPVCWTPENAAYLKTKETRLGHKFVEAKGAVDGQS
jgi:3,4-dihydroxy 2-butanone 4-phosphate synthase/GTP cyclohydrolase II